MTEPLIFENAMVVTAEDAFQGFVAVQDGTIIEVGRGRAPERGRDLAGDLLLPGLIEIHTDNLEAHYMPRPKVEWNAASAVLAYDAQIAASGITTVFDSLRVGIDEHEEKAGMGSKTTLLADEIARRQAAGHLRADHLTHIRCEVPAPGVVEALEGFLAGRTVKLLSLMDHTPGQRQFRDIDKYFIYYGGKSGKPQDEIERIVARRQTAGVARAAVNRPQVVAIAKRHGVPLASHDDTTLEDVRQSIAEGVSIAEFPTTVESAAASREAGLATVMGGPNVVRGGSHSGNVSASHLAEEGLLDILSSDYVPASLLWGALALEKTRGMGGLPGAIRLVSRNPAAATGLTDRGEIAPGKRADLIRVHRDAGNAVVREVYRQGARVA
jgi:alpha-D-ribose 1-methylphosphonate 5-triphosphate diphosphatase